MKKNPDVCRFECAIISVMPNKPCPLASQIAIIIYFFKVMVKNVHFNVELFIKPHQKMLFRNQFMTVIVFSSDSLESSERRGVASHISYQKQTFKQTGERNYFNIVKLQKFYHENATYIETFFGIIQFFLHKDRRKWPDLKHFCIISATAWSKICFSTSDSEKK